MELQGSIRNLCPKMCAHFRGLALRKWLSLHHVREGATLFSQSFLTSHPPDESGQGPQRDALAWRGTEVEIPYHEVESRNSADSLTTYIDDHGPTSTKRSSFAIFCFSARAPQNKIRAS